MLVYVTDRDAAIDARALPTPTVGVSNVVTPEGFRDLSFGIQNSPAAALRLIAITAMTDDLQIAKAIGICDGGCFKAGELGKTLKIDQLMPPTQTYAVRLVASFPNTPTSDQGRLGELKVSMAAVTSMETRPFEKTVSFMIPASADTSYRPNSP